MYTIVFRDGDGNLRTLVVESIEESERLLKLIRTFCPKACMFLTSFYESQGLEKTAKTYNI